MSLYKVIRDLPSGTQIVERQGKFFLIQKNGKISVDDYYDFIRSTEEGISLVQRDDTYNILDEYTGKLISSEWFKGVSIFVDGVCKVCNNEGAFNFLRKDGTLLSETWFDGCGNFTGNFAKVQACGKSNYLTKSGQIVSETWFDSVSSFAFGFAVVKNEGVKNYMDEKGHLLSKIWFDDCQAFEQVGVGIVKLHDKYNCIRKTGYLLHNKWFDKCTVGSNGMVDVWYYQAPLTISISTGDIFL